MNFKRIVPIAVIILAITFISWGVVGHRSIAKIAENHLTQKAKLAVTHLLGTETIPLVSTYSDEVRSIKEFSYTAPWHYVNPPQGLNYDQFVNYLKTDKNPNIYNALLKMEQQLKDPQSSKEDKVFALKFIIHLVGDLHQPFHVGKGEDQGGNKIKVKFRNRETNMHALWDSGLIEYNGFTFTEMATAFDNVDKSTIKKWQAEPVTLWLFESYQIATKLYAEVENEDELNYLYYPQHSEIYKERMQKAGIRLAGFLNDIYK